MKILSDLDVFKRRLSSDWLIPFCNARGYSLGGFDIHSIEKLSEVDARDFIQAIDTGAVRHHDGIFSAARSKAKEQIFWEGSRNSVPRKVFLWLEPIITIAGMMRMHRDFDWDLSRIGMQSQSWAFDLVGYADDCSTELLVCEVKKSEREIDNLLKHMEIHLKTPAETDFKGAERNAFKKVLALRQSKCSIFWALGPNGYSHVFNVIRDSPNSFYLEATSESALSQPTHNNAIKLT